MDKVTSELFSDSRCHILFVTRILIHNSLLSGIDPSLDQYNSNGLSNGLNHGLNEPHYRKEMNGVPRQLFPQSPVNHCEVYNVHEVTSNGKLGNGKHNFGGPFSYTNGFSNGYPRPTSNLKPMRKLRLIIIFIFFASLKRWIR